MFNHGALRIETVPHFDELGVECLSRKAHDDPPSLLVTERAAIRAGGRQSVVDVDDGDDPSQQGDGITSQTVGVSGAVPALVVIADDVKLFFHKAEQRTEAMTGDRVHLHGPALLGREWSRLVEDRIGDFDFSHVVYETAHREGAQLAGGEPELLTEPRRGDRHSVTMSRCVAVPGLGRKDESAHPG